MPVPALALTHLIVGDRLILRAPRISDAGRLVEIRADSRDFLRPWLPATTGAELDPDRTRERIRGERLAWRRDRGYRLLMTLRGDGQVVGSMALSEIVRGVFHNAYLGYWIDRRHARQGLTYEALRLVLALAFGPLALHRVQAAVMPRNAPSVALLRKAGLREEGLARRYLEIAGRWEDHLLFAVTREEWPLAPLE